MPTIHYEVCECLPPACVVRPLFKGENYGHALSVWADRAHAMLHKRTGRDGSVSLNECVWDRKLTRMDTREVFRLDVPLAPYRGDGPR